MVEYLVLPQLAGARHALHLLAGANVSFLLAGAVSKSAPSSPMPRRDGGGRRLRHRLLTEMGVGATDVGFALTTQGVGSAVVLNCLLWLGLLVSIPLRGFNPLYGAAAVLGALLLATFALAVVLLTRGEQSLARVICRVAARLPLLDAASLWVFVAAFGHSGPDGLIVSFGLANVLAAVPVTPGGLGVVEAILTSSLVGFGTPRGRARRHQLPPDQLLAAHPVGGALRTCH